MLIILSVKIELWDPDCQTKEAHLIKMQNSVGESTLPY